MSRLLTDRIPIAGSLRPGSSWSALHCLLVVLGLCAGAMAADPPVDPDGIRGPAPTPAALQRTERVLRDIFAAGYTAGPKQLAAVQKLLAPLKQEYRDDPRLDYLLGVVELRQGQLKPATAQFESFIRRSPESDWSAWQALIWALLVDKQYDSGLQRLEEFGHLVAGLSADEETSETQRDAAQWMGEIFEGLEQTVESSQKKARARIEESSGRLRERLNDELYESFEAGRELVRERALALDWKLDSARGSRSQQDQEARRRRSRRVSDKVEDAEAERREKERSAEDWKKWLDQNLEDIDKQLGRLERDYKSLEQRTRSTLESILMLEQEMAFATRMPLRSPNSGAGMPGATFDSEAQRADTIAQMQMRRYVNQVDYNLGLARMHQMSQDGVALQRLRTQTVQHYEKATGEIARRQASLDQWESRLNSQQKKLATQPPGTNARKGSGKSPPRSLKSLVAIDYDQEQRRVYEQFGLTLPLREKLPLR